MKNLYQLTDKEKELVDVYRTASENFRSFIECAIQTALESANKPLQSAKVFEFTTIKKD